ncbi:hypothetical protein [Chitinophaga sp. MM2321]|uniref:hypothetical protein n=1 Tax=Chitinophaga sp. MM2321 TaxID=3137178 RepID=UPI0032D58599
MKKLICILLVCCSFAVLPLLSTHAEKNVIKPLSIGLNVSNGTTYTLAIYLYGPTNLSAYVNPGGGSYGPLTAGNYTINMYCSAPGSHTFYFNGQSITTSTGSVTFNNVSITGTSSAAVY